MAGAVWLQYLAYSLVRLCTVSLSLLVFLILHFPPFQIYYVLTFFRMNFSWSFLQSSLLITFDVNILVPLLDKNSFPPTMKLKPRFMQLVFAKIAIR